MPISLALVVAFGVLVSPVIVGLQGLYNYDNGLRLIEIYIIKCNLHKS
jgi:hypothetical protein